MAEPRRYSPDAIHVIRTAQQIHVQLSSMADQKASILMGAAFVIFTIAINQARTGSPQLPLLILGGTAFLAALFAALAIIPSIGGGRGGPVNLLFFGSFAKLGEEDYVDRLMETIGDDESAYRAMARDLYQNGVVLAAKKYRLLGYAYRIFLVGMTASLIAFVVERY